MTTHGHAICQPAEDAALAALKAADALVNATPLDHPMRASVDALRASAARALRIAHELDWEAWSR